MAIEPLVPSDRGFDRVGTVICPACGTTVHDRFRNRDQIARELRETEHHARRRRAARTRAGPQRRAAHLMYGEPAAVYGCDACGTLMRDPRSVPADVENRYRHDRYGADALEQLWKAYRREYARDAPWLCAQGIGSGASILEIGSFVGAFLDFARSRGCDALGVDVGIEVGAFARARGLKVISEAFSMIRFGAKRFDSVWILNCFEQIPDVDAVLAAAHEVLKDDGRLVIRTPNAQFLRSASRDVLGERMRAIALVNGVAGMPFARCFSERGITMLLRRHAFADVSIRQRELVLSSVHAPDDGNSWDAGPDVEGAYARPWMDVTARRMSG